MYVCAACKERKMEKGKGKKRSAAKGRHIA
jgi:hypothetical protein